MTSVKPMKFQFKEEPQYVLVERKVFGRGRYAPHKEVWRDGRNHWEQLQGTISASAIRAFVKKFNQMDKAWRAA